MYASFSDCIIFIICLLIYVYNTQLDALEGEIVACRSSWRRQKQQEDDIINNESNIIRLMGSPDTISHSEV